MRIKKEWWLVIILIVIVLVLTILFRKDVDLSPKEKIPQKTIEQLGESSVIIKDKADCDILRGFLNDACKKVVA